MENTELEPCPFCSGAAQVLHGGLRYMATVECTKCGASVKAIDDIDPVGKAIAKWNNRSNADDEEEQETPYERMKKSIYDVIQMTCSLCKTKHCQTVQTECSGIATAKEVLAATPRNCDVMRDLSHAVNEFLKDECADGFPRKVVDWNWNHLNRFIIWLFAEAKEK